MTYVPQNKTNLIVAAAAEDPADRRTTARRRRRRRRLGRASRRTVALALLAAAVPVSVTATVVRLSRDPVPREAPLPKLGAGPDGHVIDRRPPPDVSRKLSDAFPLLRRPATGADRANAAVRNIVGHATRFGLSAGKARELARVDDRRVWLMPGNGYLCLGVQPRGDRSIGFDCASEAVALRDGVNVSDTDTIFGVLPAGVRRIEVTDDEGLRHVVSVVNQLYLLAPVSATVRYRARSGKLVSFRVIG